MIRLLFLLIVVGLQAAQLYHRVPEQLLSDVPATLEVITPVEYGDPHSVNLFLRPAGNLAFQELPFEYKEGTYRCVLPAAMISGTRLEYYIAASYDTLGYLASPVKDPHLNPYSIPVRTFDAFRHRSKQSYDRSRITDVQIIPWKQASGKPNKFPMVYLKKPSAQYMEMGYIIVSGSAEAGVPDLLDAMLLESKRIGAHAIANLSFGIYTSKPDPRRHSGVLILEGVYLQRKE